MAASVVVTIIDPDLPAHIAQYGGADRLPLGEERTLVLALVLVLALGLPLVGLIVQAVFDFRRFWSKGIALFYLYLLAPAVVAFFIGGTTGDWIAFAVQAALLVAGFVLARPIRHSLKWLFSWKGVLIVLLGGAVVGGATYGLNIGGSAIVPGVSVNQASVEAQPLVLQILTGMVVAPLAEEFLIRRTVYFAFGGGVLGGCLACFHFAFLHIAFSSDWSHILGYLFPSILLTLALMLFRNAMPSALGHVLNNVLVLLV